MYAGCTTKHIKFNIRTQLKQTVVQIENAKMIRNARWLNRSTSFTKIGANAAAPMTNMEAHSRV